MAMPYRKRKSGYGHIDFSGEYPRYKDSGRTVHSVVSNRPDGLHTHHRDGDKSNFRRSNLRNMTPSAHGTLEAKKRKRSFW